MVIEKGKEESAMHIPACRGVSWVFLSTFTGNFISRGLIGLFLF